MASGTSISRWFDAIQSGLVHQLQAGFDNLAAEFFPGFMLHQRVRLCGFHGGELVSDELPVFFLSGPVFAVGFAGSIFTCVPIACLGAVADKYQYSGNRDATSS